MAECPICKEASCPSTPAPMYQGIEYDCPRCGKFALCGPLSHELPDTFLKPPRRDVMSHRLRCLQPSDGKPVLVFQNELAVFRLDDSLPSPGEQADNLILWIGNHQSSTGDRVAIAVPAVSAWIGAAITHPNRSSGLEWLLKQPELMMCWEREDMPHLQLRLTLAGWERRKAIERAHGVNRTKAFMAMQFGDSELQHVFDVCFKEAAKQAGFDLRLLTDGQGAGLIDDQLRVALRTSRFVIADLTHGNKGAYWEAGFAEGLGRPVIYTCKKKIWDERNDPDPNKVKVHFDTAHWNTIIWDPDDLPTAEAKLTATIRNTFFAEAKMQD